MTQIKRDSSRLLNHDVLSGALQNLPESNKTLLSDQQSKIDKLRQLTVMEYLRNYGDKSDDAEVKDFKIDYMGNNIAIYLLPSGPGTLFNDDFYPMSVINTELYSGKHQVYNITVESPFVMLLDASLNVIPS